MTDKEIENILVIFGVELEKNNIRKINDEHKNKLNAAYVETFGQPINMKCSTCIVEGFFELRNRNQNQIKQNKMANNKHQLKPGIVPYIGHLKKFVTNKTMTDELAIEIVRFNEKNAKLFVNPEAILADVKNVGISKPTKQAASTNGSTGAEKKALIENDGEVQTVVIDEPEKPIQSNDGSQSDDNGEKKEKKKPGPKSKKK